MNSPTIFTYDFSAAVLDYNNMPMPVPMGPAGQEISATFALFAIGALTTSPQGSAPLSYETKAFRLALANRIKQNHTAVDLNFVERALILTLMGSFTQVASVFQRFIEMLEKTDIPAGGQKAPVVAPPVTLQEAPVSTLAAIAAANEVPVEGGEGIVS